MLIEFTKRADGRVVLRCVRADESVTWQRNDDQNARFFPLHDLTHYAVEIELGFARGFFGLIAEGWTIEETERWLSPVLNYDAKPARSVAA